MKTKDCGGLTSQNAPDLARMARDGNIGTAVAQEDVVQHLLAPDVLVGVRLAVVRLPDRVVLREPILKRIRGEAVVDVRLVAAPITSMPADRLAEVFLHFRHEGVERRQREAREGQVRRRQAP